MAIIPCLGTVIGTEGAVCERDKSIKAHKTRYMKFPNLNLYCRYSVPTM